MCPQDDETRLCMCIGPSLPSVLLQLHTRYTLWPREYMRAYTQGSLKERKLQSAHNSSLAAHLLNVGRLLWVTTHMLWTTVLPPWVACGFEGKGCEFTFPDAICMQLADNYGLFICTWPQIIPDWCLDDGLHVLQISHMLHLTPEWVGRKYAILGAFNRKMGSLYLWNYGMWSYNWQWRESQLFLNFLMHSKSKSKKRKPPAVKI